MRLGCGDAGARRGEMENLEPPNEAFPLFSTFTVWMPIESWDRYRVCNRSTWLSPMARLFFSVEVPQNLDWGCIQICSTIHLFSPFIVKTSNTWPSFNYSGRWFFKGSIKERAQHGNSPVLHFYTIWWPVLIWLGITFRKVVQWFLQ